MSDTYINICEDNGNILAVFTDWHHLTYVPFIANDIGVLAMSFDANNEHAAKILQEDRRLEVYRNGHKEQAYFVRYWEDTIRKGINTVEVEAFDAKYLLDSKVNPYAAETSQSTITDNAADIMKAIVRNNLTAATDSTRNISSTYLSVAADLGDGVSMTFSLAYDNVLAAIKAIAEASWTGGTRLYFDVVPITDTKYEFRTYTGQPGVDRSSTSTTNQQLIFGVEWKNISQSSVINDYKNERNYIYAGGQGDKSARVIKTATDATRTGRSLFNRRELFVDARQYADSNAVQAEANKALAENRPRRRFAATILDIAECAYGKHWNGGDAVIGMHKGQSYDCIINLVTIELQKKEEKIEAYLEALA